MVHTYHAHIYFDLSQRALAQQVHQRIVDAIPALSYIGKLIPKPIGPHPKPMFEIHIPSSALNESITTIDALRDGLDVLIHPVHSDDLAAHTTDAKWLGKPLQLNVAIFKQ